MNKYCQLRCMNKENFIKKYLLKNSLFPEDDLKFYMQFHITKLIEISGLMED